MSAWRDTLVKPPDYPAAAADFYRRVAERLMFSAQLVAGGRPCRVTELEAYDFSPRHPDPYAHRHPQQKNPCGWYFHRAGSGYRGGSYKGLDLAIGDAESCTGMLIRGLTLPDGRAVDGPSLCVDAILGLTGCATVRGLAAAVESRGADDVGSPLHFAEAPPELGELAAGPRVGLSLKTHAAETWRTSLDYLFRPYRFVRLPRAGEKGAAQLVACELSAGAADDAQIAAKLALKARRVAGVRAAFERGRKLPESAVRALMGTKLSESSWVELSGFWMRVKDSGKSH